MGRLAGKTVGSASAQSVASVVAGPVRMRGWEVVAQRKQKQSVVVAAELGIAVVPVCSFP